MFNVSEKTVNENKAIRILFQKLADENYKQRECKNIFIISVVPKGFKNSKYDEFEKQILCNNNYNRYEPTSYYVAIIIIMLLISLLRL